MPLLPKEPKTSAPPARRGRRGSPPSDPDADLLSRRTRTARARRHGRPTTITQVETNLGRFVAARGACPVGLDPGPARHRLYVVFHCGGHQVVSSHTPFVAGVRRRENVNERPTVEARSAHTDVTKTSEPAENVTPGEFPVNVAMTLKAGSIERVLRDPDGAASVAC